MKMIKEDNLWKHLEWDQDIEKFTLYGVDEDLTQLTIIEAEPVVRCKDCKYRGDYGCPMYYEEYVEWDDDGYHEMEIVEHDHTVDNGFCDRGEKMDKEQI